MSTIEMDMNEGEIIDQRFFSDPAIDQIIRNVIGRDRVVVLTCMTQPRMAPYMNPQTWMQEFRVCKRWSITFSYGGETPIPSGEFEIPVTDVSYTMKEVVQYMKGR